MVLQGVWAMYGRVSGWWYSSLDHGMMSSPCYGRVSRWWYSSLGHGMVGCVGHAMVRCLAHDLTDSLASVMDVLGGLHCLFII